MIIHGICFEKFYNLEYVGIAVSQPFRRQAIRQTLQAQLHRFTFLITQLWIDILVRLHLTKLIKYNHSYSKFGFLSIISDLVNIVIIQCTGGKGAQDVVFIRIQGCYLQWMDILNSLVVFNCCNFDL